MNDVTLDSLIRLYEDNRDQIKQLVDRLEKLTNDVDNLLPKEYNGRTRFIFEDRIKLITQLFDTILRYRSELAKLLEKEIMIRKDIFSMSDEDIVNDISALPTEKVNEILNKIERLTQQMQDMPR
jgi:hypothetical protein